MESREKVELSSRMYLLAEQHGVGQPLALYNLQLRWKRCLNFIDYFLLTSVICAVLFVFIVFAIFIYQVVNHQIMDVQWRLLLSLPGPISGLIGCVFCMYIRYMVVQRFCISCLVCTVTYLVKWFSRTNSAQQ